MKFQLFLILSFTVLLSSCGPSEEELRAELREINGELMAINIAANRYRAQMNQAEVDAFFGSFAAGYGATSGNYGLAHDGYSTASNATYQYDVSSYSLDQLRSRQANLLKRKIKVIEKLN